MNNYVFIQSNELAHHGIKGQKWGIRRFQNEDGSLTKAGQRRYGKYEEAAKAYAKSYNEVVEWNTYVQDYTYKTLSSERRRALERGEYSLKDAISDVSLNDPVFRERVRKGLEIYEKNKQDYQKLLKSTPDYGFKFDQDVFNSINAKYKLRK